MVAVCVGLVVPTGSVVPVEDACVTVSVAELLVTPLRLAVMVAAPAPMAEARPELPMVTADKFDDAQAAEAVRFCVLLSLYVPVAAYCWVCPTWMVEFAGEIAMDCNVGAAVAMV